jgi:DNA-binding transcriptional MerR regulator
MTIHSVASSRLILDTPDAADLLGVSPRTLEDWRWRGIGPPFYKLGRRIVRYRAEDLITFALKSKRQNTGGDEMSQ